MAKKNVMRHTLGPSSVPECHRLAVRAGANGTVSGPTKAHSKVIKSVVFWNALPLPEGVKRREGGLITVEFKNAATALVAYLSESAAKAEVPGSATVGLERDAKVQDWMNQRGLIRGYWWLIEIIRLAATCRLPANDLPSLSGTRAEEIATELLAFLRRAPAPVARAADALLAWGDEESALPALPMDDNKWKHVKANLHRLSKAKWSERVGGDASLAAAKRWWGELLDAAEKRSDLRWPVFGFQGRVDWSQIDLVDAHAWVTRWGADRMGVRLAVCTLSALAAERQPKAADPLQSVAGAEIPLLLDWLESRLDWANTTGSARKWWEDFKVANPQRQRLVARLAFELFRRKSTVTKFFLAYVYSNTDNIQANLSFGDYTKIKEEEQKALREKQLLRPAYDFLDAGAMICKHGRPTESAEVLAEMYDELMIRVHANELGSEQRMDWEAYRLEHKEDPACIVHLAIEIAARGGRLSEFLRVVRRSDGLKGHVERRPVTRSWSGQLAYFDYHTLKVAEERKKMLTEKERQRVQHERGPAADGPPTEGSPPGSGTSGKG
ncbi:MAG: hypothetical protein ACT4PL_13045 [Phycisphaerales bacterium]